MKKQLFLFAALALTVSAPLLTSCSDDNNDSPQNPEVIDDESVVQTDGEAFALVAGGFGAYQDLSSTFSELSDGATEYGSGYLGEEGNGSDEKVFTFDADETTDYPAWAWEDLYWSIGVENDAIEKITASTKVSEAAKREAIARAKFVRALDYSLLVVYFGEVPLRLTVEDESTERAGIDAVYAQIVKDLTEAEADLPATTSTPVTPCKGAANALLARVYLQWASALTASQVAAIASSKSDPQLSYDRSRLEQAVAYADKVIASGNYSLVSQFANLFGRANESRAPEHIFTIQQDGDGIDVMGNHQFHCAWTFPFQELTGKESHIHPASTFDEWDDADTRKAFSVLSQLTDPRTGELHTFLPPVTLPFYGKGVDRSYSNSVYETIEKNDVDQIQIRYAEVLLTKAEALVQLGRASEAVALVNQIRSRAYGDDTHNLTSVTLADVQDEWAHEFLYEQKRWQALVRWGNLIETVQGVSRFQHFDESYATSGSTAVDGSTVNAIIARNHAVLRAKYNNVSGRNYRFPIPLREDGSGLEAEQNPGY